MCVCVCVCVCYKRPRGYRLGPQFKSCWLRFNTACLAAILLVQLAGGKSNLLFALCYFPAFLLTPSLLILPLSSVFKLYVSAHLSVSLPLFCLSFPRSTFGAFSLSLSLSLSPPPPSTSTYSQYDSISFIGSKCVCGAEVRITVGIKTGNAFAFNGPRQW